MATATKDIIAAKDGKKPTLLPAPNSDFYELVETLPAEELAVIKQVRAFMETKVAPIITKYWVEDAFPFEVLPAVKELNLGGLGMTGYGCRGGSSLLFGLVEMEMARIDVSFATFFGVHNAMGLDLFDRAERFTVDRESPRIRTQEDSVGGGHESDGFKQVRMWGILRHPHSGAVPTA
jgi:alkylation response protein AidB-like acyl-CoA dehydrogenase